MSDVNVTATDDAPLTMSEAIEALTATEAQEPPNEGQADEDKAREGNEADDALPTDEDGEDEGDPDDEEQAEDGDDSEDDTEESDGGRFVSDNAKIKLEDGSVLTVAELKKGTLLHRDYTQKTQAVAEERRQVQSEREQVTQQQQHFQQLREWTEQVLQSTLPAAPEPWQGTPDRDPLGYMNHLEQERAYNARVQQLQYIQATREAEAQEAQMRQADEARERANREWATLIEKMPALADESRRKAIVGDLFKYGQENGFNEQEIRSALAFDHRQALILDKARKWDQLQANKTKAQTKVEGRPPVQKGGKRINPGQQQVRQKQAAMERLNRSGSLKDAIAAIATIEEG